MELIADTKLVFSAQCFPTSTPILDVLRPLPMQQRDRLSTGSYFLISSAIILGVSEIYLLRYFADSITTAQSGPVLAIAFILLPCLAFLAAIAIHEAGHLIAGRIVGFEPVRIKVGPFSFTADDGRQKLRSDEILPLGFAVLKPKSKDGLQRRLFYLVLGGPLANLFLPLLLESVFYVLPVHWGTGYFLAAFSVHVFSVVALLFGIASLLPDTNANGNFSDGARIIMLLKNDLRAARWLAIIQLQLALNQGEHPRNWDENLVNRAVAVKDDSLDTVVANWLGYLWAAGHQQLSRATKYLDNALAVMGSSPSSLRDQLFLEAAVFQAWYRNSPTKAQFWISQIGHGNCLSPLQNMRLEIALLWAQGRSFMAWEKLAEYLELVRELPPSSVRDLAERGVLDWKAQMESRMVAGAWATMTALSEENSTELPSEESTPMTEAY
ncbi:MAG TPA: site-2 protease family protein [Candidatus Angelobacter sp.]|jgi:hypothetical protein|nr:site-2 protease family protein [Candidatus Angelobacter sp.]